MTHRCEAQRRLVPGDLGSARDPLPGRINPSSLFLGIGLSLGSTVSLCVASSLTFWLVSAVPPPYWNVSSFGTGLCCLSCAQQKACAPRWSFMPPSGRRGAVHHQGWGVCVSLTNRKNGAQRFSDFSKATKLPGQTGPSQP